MATQYNLQWALTSWDNRASATYQNLNTSIEGKSCNEYGWLTGEVGFNNHTPRPLTHLDQNSNYIYKSFEPSNRVSAVFRYTISE